MAISFFTRESRRKREACDVDLCWKQIKITEYLKRATDLLIRERFTSEIIFGNHFAR